LLRYTTCDVLLPQWDTACHNFRETDEADFHRLDSNTSEDEALRDRVAGVRIDDLVAIDEGRERAGRRSERADVLVREIRRNGWRRRRRNHRRRLARVTDPVLIEVGLIGVVLVGTVVLEIGNAVLVAVRRRWRRLGCRRRRWRRRFLEGEQIAIALVAAGLRIEPLEMNRLDARHERLLLRRHGRRRLLALVQCGAGRVLLLAHGL